METEHIELQSSEEIETEREKGIKALARQVYDEGRRFVFVPQGMVNQVHRYGFLPKKSIDGSGYTRMHGPRNYWRE